MRICLFGGGGIENSTEGTYSRELNTVEQIFKVGMKGRLFLNYDKNSVGLGRYDQSVGDDSHRGSIDNDKVVNELKTVEKLVKCGEVRSSEGLGGVTPAGRTSK